MAIVILGIFFHPNDIIFKEFFFHLFCAFSQIPQDGIEQYLSTREKQWNLFNKIWRVVNRNIFMCIKNGLFLEAGKTHMHIIQRLHPISFLVFHKQENDRIIAFKCINDRYLFNFVCGFSSLFFIPDRRPQYTRHKPHTS